MTINGLRKQFPDEEACRQFFESVIWASSRICPHCCHFESWEIKAKSARSGLYLCRECRLQFTVTTKTPLHSTKLPLWTWLLAMYLISSSSKGISSIVLARLIGTTQKTAWKVGHAIRAMMDSASAIAPQLKGTVELDEKYLGGAPRYQEGITNKRGKGTKKQCIAVAVERKGPVQASLVSNDGERALRPFIEENVAPSAYLMSDQNPAYTEIAKGFASHSSVNHGKKEFVRGDIHNNTAESFNATLERAKLGVFHYLSKKHMQRYVDEAVFRWNQRMPEAMTTKRGHTKIVMKPVPVIEKCSAMIRAAMNVQLRWTSMGSIRAISC